MLPGKRFCRSCGAPLGGSSAEAGSAPASYTPKHLTEKILTSRSALEGERKQVTVLFADLKGSMELLADRDPEEARQLLDPVLQLMMDAVHRYEGTVNQVMGDGIMALFGAPVAHEDHGVRACYAALRMQELVTRHARDVRRTHGVNVQIRVGLNSGEVVVRAIGGDLRMDYTAVGQTTHLAARMEQLARPGSILLTPGTLSLVEDFVAVKPLGPVPVKGVADPVEVYEVTGAGPARTRLQAAGRRGLTRFVGRDEELGQLRRILELAQAGHGRVAAIVGEAGVGKSRLVYELTHSHRLEGWRVLESAAMSYGRTAGYLPVIDLLKGYFKIDARDDLRGIREKVTGKLLILDEALRPLLPPLLALLDAPVDDAEGNALDPGPRRRPTLDAIVRLLLREAREQPLLVICEDLHWIDSETQALLDALVEGLGSAPLLLLVTYRPEYRHTWGGSSSYSQLRLDALPAQSATELLESLLGDDAGLAPLKGLLSGRGNPLFLEETVRMLAETKTLAGSRGRYRLVRPVQAIQVPPTVQALLAARIDRLPAEDKRLLQVAAVIGKDVPAPLLQAIAELPEDALRQGLDRLQGGDFLYETGLYPDHEYAFTHALTHDVAYGSLLRERRRELHARIVGAIEALHRDRLAEQAERLAHHALQGELREKAVHYLRQAGLKAWTRWALPDARAWFEQALEVLAALPESPATMEQAFEVRLELRPVLNQLGQVREVRECLREAEGLAERLNDDRRRGQVCANLTNVQGLLGELDEAVVAGNRALEIARRLADLRLRIVTTSYLEWAHYLRGEYQQIVELATGNLAALPPDWIHERFGRAAAASVDDRIWLVMGLIELGCFAAAAEHADEAARLAELMSHPYGIGMAHRIVGVLHLGRGSWPIARKHLEHAAEMFRTRDVLLQLSSVVAPAALVLAHLGETGAALDRLREGEQLVDLLTARGIVGFLGGAYHTLGRASLLLGRLGEARRLADRAVETSPSQPGFAAHARRLLGDIAAHPDRLDAAAAETQYRQALALAEPRGMRPLVAHCHLGLGQLHGRTGKWEQGRAHLIAATALYRDMGMGFWLEHAEAASRGMEEGRDAR